MTGKEVAQSTLNSVKKVLGGVPTCPLCGNNHWAVSDEIGITGTLDPDTNNVDPSRGTPSVNLVCNRCGFIAHINPKIHGAM